MRAMTDEKGVGSNYVANLLSTALLTAAESESPEVRESAARRVDRFQRALEGMSSGAIEVGSRTPVKDLPAWVTLEVVRGGFATGRGAAQVEMSQDEARLINDFGMSGGRGEIFRFLLTDQGQSLLREMIRTRSFSIDYPEQAALLTVNWLLDRGDRDGALQILEHIAPLADRLRFLPTTTNEPSSDRKTFFRWSVDEALERVENTKGNKQVETMRESLTVWNPLLDEFVSLWQRRLEDRRIVEGNAEWKREASEVLARYEAATSMYLRCSKHRKPKENLFILREAVELELKGDLLTARQLGKVRCVLEDIDRKRGMPVGERNKELRLRQSFIAAQALHSEFAPLIAKRLRELPAHRGVPNVDAMSGAVSDKEATDRVPAGSRIPSRYHRIIARSRQATLNELLGSWAIPSAEILATFSSGLVAGALARSYADLDLGEIMATNYEVFRKRRSLLLLNLEKQVQIGELPWVQAAAPYFNQNDQAAKDVLRVLAAMTLRHFPATLIPNPMTRELATLAHQASLGSPFVEELAADIFMGSFSAKFLAATKAAGKHLTDSLYSRYYDIDYGAIASFPEPPPMQAGGPKVSKEFDLLCKQRSAMNNCAGRWIVENGATIEQAQILSTHNIAPLLFDVGVFQPGDKVDLDDLNQGVRRSLNSLDISSMIDGTYNVVHWNLRTGMMGPRPLSFVKDLAYAWRQMIIYLCTLPQPDQISWINRKLEQVQSPSDDSPLKKCMPMMLGGLAHCAKGGVFEPDGTCPGGRRLLGWSASHWLLEMLRMQ
jgi:hypothetical protein